MEDIKKALAIFNRKQKTQLIVLFFIEFIGSLLEMLGVYALIPVLQIVLEPDEMLENPYISRMKELFAIQTAQGLIFFMIGAMVFVYAIKNLYLIFMTYVQYQIIWRNRLRMENDVMAYYVRQPYMFHVQHNSAEMQRTILTDIGNVFDVVHSVFQLISDLLTVTMLVILMLVTDIGITVALLLLLLVFVLFYFKIFKRRLYQYGQISQYYGAEGLKCINQIFNGIKEIKVNESEAYFIKEFSDGRRIQTSMMKRGAFFQQTPKYLLEMLIVGGILGSLFIKLWTGAEISHMVAQMGMLALAAYRILPAVNHITAELAYIFNNKASIDLIYQVICEDNIEFDGMKTIEREAERESEDGKRLGNIKLQNVSFCYPTSKTMILNDVTLEIEGGTAVAFKGPSGAGKTTTADIILGILPPVEGAVFYDGRDIREMGKAWYRHVGYIPQNIYLSDDTIRKNVAFGAEYPDEDQIWRALEAAQLKEFVEEQPNGLDTRIGEGGVRISGGQRQRIGIARALYHDPEIMILDEATSALDNETERAVMEAVDYLRGRKTLIIIAHRLSTIENCDVIYEVKKGQIRCCSYK